jgi:hypothetical protein
MRNISLLITASRRATENEEFTDTAGIQDEEFLQYFNDGQEEIHAVLNSLFPHILMGEATVTVVQNQESYSIPDMAYMGTRIDMVEYSQTGQAKDYYPLKKGSLKERLNGQSSDPSFYIRNGSQILLQPPPQQGGTLRISFQKKIARLDKQRATVLSATLDGSTKTVTALTLDPNQALDATALTEENYLTIVDKYGVVKMKAIPVDSIDTSTGVVTLSAGFVYETGESIAAGDFAVRGKYSSTYSELPEVCEKYLLEYANTRILMRDSSTDADAIAQILAKVQQTLQTAFAEPDSDPDYVPVLDGQYLGWDSY